MAAAVDAERLAELRRVGAPREVLRRLLRASTRAKRDEAAVDKVQRQLRLLRRVYKFMCSMGTRLCLNLLPLRLLRRVQLPEPAVDVAVRLAAAEAEQALAVAEQVVQRPRAAGVRLPRLFQ